MNVRYLDRPTGIYVISSVNLALGVLIGVGVFFHYHGLQPLKLAAKPLLYANVIIAVGMVVSAVGVFFGIRVFRSATRIFLYVMALYEALLALLQLTQHWNGTVLVTFVLSVLLVLYCIGARGYLNVEGARQFFGEPGQLPA